MSVCAIRVCLSVPIPFLFAFGLYFHESIAQHRKRKAFMTSPQAVIKFLSDTQRIWFGVERIRETFMREIPNYLCIDDNQFKLHPERIFQYILNAFDRAFFLFAFVLLINSFEGKQKRKENQSHRDRDRPRVYRMAINSEGYE